MIKEKITALVKKEEKPNKKKIENLVFAIILLIITLFVINNVFSGDKKKTITNTTIPKEVEQVAQTRDIEKELEETLGKIKGVEDVKVLITYSETEKVVPIYNESSSQSSTQEKDTEGGERKIETYDTNKEVVSDANQTIITEKIMYPKMEGAIVIAKGAQNTIVKENITHAVEAATGLAVHKIQVFEMKWNKKIQNTIENIIRLVKATIGLPYIIVL